MKILVVAELTFASGRDILSGIFRYLAETDGWDLQLIQDRGKFTAESIIHAEQKGFGGIIMTLPGTRDAMSRLSESPLPVVSIPVTPELEGRTGKTAFVHNDNHQIGELAAEHLLSRGKFNAFLFIPKEDGYGWSKAREEAMRTLLGRRGIELHTFPGGMPIGSTEEKAEMSRWLASFPTPIGIFAACDPRAVHALSACHDAGIKVPSQASILGVDNDEFFCRHSVPPLSSILPGHEEMGYMAAAELNRLIRTVETIEPRSINVKAKCVVSRESTSSRSPSATLVHDADEFIRRNACSGIGVKDVVAHLGGVSRRLLELRYREVKNTSIRAAIEHRKLEAVKTMLCRSNRKMTLIASECGFSSLNRLSHIFTQRFGIPMREFRRNRRVS